MPSYSAASSRSNFETEAGFNRGRTLSLHSVLPPVRGGTYDNSDLRRETGDTDYVHGIPLPDADWIPEFERHTRSLLEAIGALSEVLEEFPPLVGFKDTVQRLKHRLRVTANSLAPSDRRPVLHDFWTLSPEFEGFLSDFLKCTDLDNDVTTQLLSPLRTRFRQWTRRAGDPVLRYLRDPDYTNVARVAALTDTLDLLLEDLTSLLVRFVDEGESQSYGSLILSTMATLLSAVVATTLQFSYENQTTRTEQAVNFLWLASLMLSIASAINSQLAYYLDLEHYRSPDSRLARLALMCITGTPVMYIVAAVIAFSAGLVCFAFTTFADHRWISVTVAALTAMISATLGAVIFSFAGERYGLFESAAWKRMRAARSAFFRFWVNVRLYISRKAISCLNGIRRAFGLPALPVAPPGAPGEIALENLGASKKAQMSKDVESQKEASTRPQYPLLPLASLPSTSADPYSAYAERHRYPPIPAEPEIGRRPKRNKGPIVALAFSTPPESTTDAKGDDERAAQEKIIKENIERSFAQMGASRPEAPLPISTIAGPSSPHRENTSLVHPLAGSSAAPAPFISIVVTSPESVSGVDDGAENQQERREESDAPSSVPSSEERVEGSQEPSVDADSTAHPIMELPTELANTSPGSEVEASAAGKGGPGLEARDVETPSASVQSASSPVTVSSAQHPLDDTSAHSNEEGESFRRDMLGPVSTHDSAGGAGTFAG